MHYHIYGMLKSKASEFFFFCVQYVLHITRLSLHPSATRGLRVVVWERRGRVDSCSASRPGDRGLIPGPYGVGILTLPCPSRLKCGAYCDTGAILNFKTTFCSTLNKLS